MKLTISIDREMVEHLFYEYIDRDKEHKRIIKDVCDENWDAVTCRNGSMKEDGCCESCLFHRAYDMEYVALKVVCDVLEKHIDECVLISKE